ncbi:hypothetical protein [Reichenbachiella ulvae]|uniref:FixH protein n=1 Tax=Reichenbachiella ulvae TaxID=2980104 RepID=A0ABT3CVN3_9BACT|nr:hypothetical protein [Reichenbachiella ulvae]MCV9387760.1 hypothetical protein [Reichenbachiella ulvae]
MKKLIIISLVIIATGIASLISYYSYRHYQRELANPNSIELINHSTYPKDDFKILWSSGYENQQIPVYAKGRDLKVYFKTYGKNRFEVFYLDSLLTTFHQFKTNDWHGHHYSFIIEKDLNVDWEVLGPDTTKTYKAQ